MKNLLGAFSASRCGCAQCQPSGGGLGGEGRSGAKIVQGERRTKTKLEGFVFLLPFGVYSDKIITFAIRMDGTALPLSCYIVG